MRTSKLSPAQLRKAYKRDLAEAWALGLRKHPDHIPYAFVLWGIEGGEPPRFTPAILTEQGLTQVAQRYLKKGYHDTLDEARAALRYSVADSPFEDELYNTTPTVDALVEPHAEWLDDEKGYALLAKAAIAALGDLDAEGYFGAGAERERLLLIIITEDTPKDWSHESARKLNPASVYDRFAAETRVEGAHRSCAALALSPDGRSIYSIGSRANPDSKDRDRRDEFISQLIAYDLNGRHLSPRWAYEFAGWGDSFRRVACMPDGRSLVSLRGTYQKEGCQTRLMRFGSDSNEPVGAYETAGEPARLAISPDGSRIALVLQKALHLLDGDLRPLATHALKVAHPLFLRTGELLLPSDQGVMRSDWDLASPPATASPLRAFELSTDANETLVAVGRWFDVFGPESERHKEFGVHLLRLPTMDLVRTFLVPGHQAVTPALSPDGRLLACVLHAIGNPRHTLAVFDVASGQMIGRRKVWNVNAVTFLSDSRTLAFGTSGRMEGEPIVFWTLSNEGGVVETVER